MPVVRCLKKASRVASPEEEAIRRQLLNKIATSSDESNQRLLPKEDDDSAISDDDSSEEGIKDSDDYKLFESLVDRSRDIPLQKMAYSGEGCDLFNELCLRIDINQRYASFLPQWTDVAHLLEVDSLRTKWIETCVRPREGLTRAMLEIYMNDGGTLGDVLGALLKLECYDILEAVKPKAQKYVNFHAMGSTFDPSSGQQNNNVNERFFSVIKTLIGAMGKDDPCAEDLQKFKNGLKFAASLSRMPMDSSVGTGYTTQTVQHVGVVQGGYEEQPNYAACVSKGRSLYDDETIPHFKSELHLSQFKKDTEISGSGKQKCKILLLFSNDGVEAAEQVVSMASLVEHPEVKPDIFRLNEVSLWYEAISNPEACCLKWSYEADYIMPVLTPMFLQEIHCHGLENDDGLMPTSPVLNRYMYTLARTQYTQAGSKNLKVRPVIPLPVLRQIRMSNAVKIDPLLNSSWVALNEERFTRRLNGMLGEYARRRSLNETG